MNFAQLVIKQMRQRRLLSTCLTLLSVLLGVSLAVSIMIVRREGQRMFAQSDFGYDVIVGPPLGSKLLLTLNTVYHLDQSPGVIPFQVYEDLLPNTPDHATKYGLYTRSAIPLLVGDSYKGRRIIGTSPAMFGFDDDGKPVAKNKFQYRDGLSYELAAGRVFGLRKFEAVIGSDAAASLHLHLYDDKLDEIANEAAGGAFRATHGMPAPTENPDIHKPRWHIVGILKPTHTASDRALFIPYISGYAITEHEEGIDAQHIDRLLGAGLKPLEAAAQLRREGLEPAGMSRAARKQLAERILRQMTESLAKPATIPVELKKAGLEPDLLAESDQRSLVIKITQQLSAEGMNPPKIPDELRKFGLDPYLLPPMGRIAVELPEPTTRPVTKPATRSGDAVDAGGSEHQEEAYTLDENGNIVPELAKEAWELSAVLVESKGPKFTTDFTDYFFKIIDTRATAANPAMVMRDFFDTFLAGSARLLLLISAFVTIVAAASIMTTIYNSVTARSREIAILRALGATRTRILALICFEAALIGLVGGLMGLIAGHIFMGIASAITQARFGESINWLSPGIEEFAYIAAVTLVAFLAGLVPALKAYGTPVAENLTSA